MEAKESCKFKILMFPWLAHGHIFPYLELAKRIVKRKNFHIYFCTTFINFSSIENFIEKNLLHDSIELVELYLEPSRELPPHYHTTKNLPPNLNRTLMKTFQTGNISFSNIISVVKPNLVIYDLVQPWAPKIASSQGISAVYFSASGAAARSYTHHVFSGTDPGSAFPVLYASDKEKESWNMFTEFLNANVYVEDKHISVNYKLSCDIVLLKTSRALERRYMDYFSTICEKQLVPVGPLVSDVSKMDDAGAEIIEWLSKKNPNTTVYISFGSEYFLSKEEIEEIAKGIELCDVNFIWVIRFPIDEKQVILEEALPLGFLDRVKNRGIIVQGWAPQANILAHPSTGGFISHCGWSSTNESIYYGVPVIGMPMDNDMFVNARLTVEAGVGVEVPRDKNNVFKGEEIAKAINKVFVEMDADEIRRRARELSEAIRTEEEQALDEMAEHLWRLCSKNN